MNFQNNRFKKLITIMFLIFLLIVIIYIINRFMFNNSYKNNYSVTEVVNINNSISDNDFDLPDIGSLQNKYNNKDIKGIVYVPGVKIKEPVVQSENNNYYLWNNLYRKQDNRGATFFDYRNDLDIDKKIIIYGHNSYNYNLPFKNLENYYKKKYFNKHKYIYLKNAFGTFKYKIFSIYIETSDWSYTKIKFSNSNEWFKHLKYLKDKSWYDTGTSINKNDDILVLQTCSHHKKYKNYSNKYLVVVAKKIN